VRNSELYSLEQTADTVEKNGLECGSLNQLIFPNGLRIKILQ
jgi:hypothetical protein